MGDDFKNGNRLTEKEKSEPLNADLERLRSGGGPDIRCDGKQMEPPFALWFRPAAMLALREGGRLEELFPDAFYNEPHGRSS
jgi:hypothetical protein